ncbi:MAG: hypothetical protein M1819_000040 [Sarea resinae]|nr:MAG: hypothetical protein M1819_000040 [Sarea resinae]
MAVVVDIAIGPGINEVEAQSNVAPSWSQSASPPSTPLREEELGGLSRKPGKAREVDDSPTATFRTSPLTKESSGRISPGLPPLPTLPTFGHGVEIPSSPPDDQQTDSTHYYTASWGSPYQRPAPGTSTGASFHRHRTLDGESGDESPFLSVRTDNSRHSGLSSIDAPTPTRRERHPSSGLPPSLAAALSGSLGKDSIRGFTEDWIRQYLSGDLDSERRNWWSDDSSSETISLGEGSGGSADETGNGWLTIDGEDGKEGSSPSSLTDFVKRRESGRKRATKEGESTRRHRSRTSNATLKPEDFLDILDPSRNSSTLTDNMLASKYADPPSLPKEQVEGPQRPAPAVQPATKSPNPTPVADKPLPPPPPSESPIPIIRVPESTSPGTETPSSTPKPSSSPVSAGHLARKKLTWRGRACVVALPIDIPRGPGTSRPLPLTRSEVDARLKQWMADGYDVEGFGLSRKSKSTEDVANDGQSRQLYPDPSESRAEWERGSYRVSIPDRRDWEAYVNHLQEEKLRALGVSFGDEEVAPTVSPAPSSMGRQASSQYQPLPFASPPPTSSAASNHNMQLANPFSPPFVPGASTNPSSQVASIASPASSHAQPQGGFHAPKQSISFPNGEQAFASPFQFPQSQPTPPVQGMWSPPGYFNQHVGARGGSPAILGSLGAALSPGSPFNQDMSQPDLLTHMRQQQQQLQNQLLLQQQQQQQILNAQHSPHLEELQETEEEEASPSPVEDPAPDQQPESQAQGSTEKFQRHISDAEYHLEESIERQMDEDDERLDTNQTSTFDASKFGQYDDGPGNDSSKEHRGHPSIGRNAERPTYEGLGDEWPKDEAPAFAQEAPDRSTEPTLHHPQPHNRAHSLSKQRYDGDTMSTSAMAMLNAETPYGNGSRHMHDDLSEGARTNLSDTDTNPSVSGTPARMFENAHGQNMSISANPWLDSKSTPIDGKARPSFHQTPSGHGSSGSVPKFNVEAKEFKFNPASSFTPGNFSFSGNNFQPAQPAHPAFTPPHHSTTGSRISNGSFGGMSSFNVGAPAFKPGAAFPTGDFSFSSSGPAFKPTAPGFSPLIGAATDLGSSIGSRAVDAPTPARRDRIFSPMNLVDIVKPTKKSKAIPIVRPDEIPGDGGSGDGELDADGRLTQTDARLKRVRHQGGDGDEVPQFADDFTTQFAIPTHPLTETGQSQSGNKEPQRFSNSSLGKENAVPHDQSEGIASESDAVQPKGQERFAINEASDNVIKAIEVKPSAQASPKAQSEAEASRDTDSAASVHENDTTANKKHRMADSHSETHKQSKNSSLSAMAKPFEFKHSEPAFDPTFSKKPSPVPKTKGLDGSRFAHSPSPPPLPGQTSSTTLRPSEVGSFRDDVFEPTKDAPPLDSEGIDYSSLIQPSYDEIDAVMRHLNQDDSDLGVERNGSPWRRSSPVQAQLPTLERPTSAQQLPLDLHPRSDAPSPSPGRFQQQYQYLPKESRALGSPAPVIRPPGFKRTGIAYDSPIHRLNSPGDVPASDWDDMISSGEEAKLPTRSKFFDNRVDNIVDGLLRQRLGPLEETLNVIQNSLTNLSARPFSRRDRRSVSAEVANSDADDEDDMEEGIPPRSISPRKDRKMEKIKAAVYEAMSVVQADRNNVASPVVWSDVQQTLLEIKSSFVQAARPETQIDDIKTVVQEAISQQMLALEKPKKNMTPEVELRLAALESMLKEADLRAGEELMARRAAEDRAAETQRRLQIAEEEAFRQRDLAEESQRKLRVLDDKRHQSLMQTQMRTALLEGAQESLQKSVSDLNAKNDALEETIDEYRLSSDRWRREVDEKKEENGSLKRTIGALKSQMEESIRVRENMRGKFDRLQEDMATATRDIAREQATWRKKDEEHKAKLEMTLARLEAEARTRERLERELERLENQEREAMKMRVVVEQTQNANSRLEEMVNKLRMESLEHQKTAARFEREFGEAREAGRMEIRRTRVLMEADIEAANNQVNIVRADLESELARTRNELENVKLDADTAKEKSELELEEAAESKKAALREASESKRVALREASEARDAAVKEQHRKYERYLEEMRAQHDRALRNALEDKQRAETHLLERLSLSDAKAEHLQDRVAHLAEKLEIAKSAAHAAAQAAQSARVVSTASPSVGSLTAERRSDEPERISPQALRESIMVLQEQLQEREGRIEKLEQELSNADTEAPSKIKERDSEIGWLRELLGVRIGDLEDIIKTLSQPKYDRDAVKDAAIRLKANLQMEQQERERAMSGSQGFPSLGNLANLASPKAVLPLAAAWGNWRRGRDRSFGNTSDAAANSPTPSKPSPSAQSFLSGLMTPPSTHVRQTPQAPNTETFTARRSAPAPLELTKSNSQPSLSSRQKEKQRAPSPPAPSTPPLLRKGSYDQDAEDNFSTSGFYDDDDSTADGHGHGIGEGNEFSTESDSHDLHAEAGDELFAPLV